MIERAQANFWLRWRTLSTFFKVSFVAFALLPVASVVCLAAGGIAFGACWLPIVLLFVLGFGGCIGGVIAILAGWGEGGDKGGGMAAGGIGAAIVGGFSLHFLEKWHGSLSTAAIISFEACRSAAKYIFEDLWRDYYVYAWSWTPLTVCLGVASVLLFTIGLLSLETPFKYYLLRIGYRCPKCHLRGVPTFRCSGCSNLIDDLHPTRYGIFRARCGKCGCKLPTVDLFGRLSLLKVCSNSICARDLENADLGRKSEFHIGLVGAASSGKSTFLVSSLWKFLTEFAPQNGLTVRFASPADQQAYDQWIQQLQTGVVVSKTASTPVPSAFTVSVESRNGQGCLLYIYDAAGEDLSEESRMADFHFHRHIDGLVFVIDPFAEDGIRDWLLTERNVRDVQTQNPGAQPAGDILARLVARLERVLSRPAGTKLPVPVAVVVTKLDAHGLEQEVGGISDVSQRYFSTARAAETAAGKSKSVQQFLRNTGLGNVLNVLETRFARVKYFGVTALGRDPSNQNSTAFSPRGTSAPLVWLAYYSGALTNSSTFRQMIRNSTTIYRRALWGQEGRKAQAVGWGMMICAVSVVVCVLLYGLSQ